MKIMAYEHVFSITDWIGICNLENEMSTLLAWTPHPASEIISGFKVFIQISQCHQPLFRSLFMLCFFLLLISSDLVFLTECSVFLISSDLAKPSLNTCLVVLWFFLI